MGQSLYRTINFKYPQIFEWMFSFFLKKWIKNNFIPNQYLFFENSSQIDKWPKEYIHYFKLREAEYLNPYLDYREILPYGVFRWYSGYFYIQINEYLRSLANFTEQLVTSRIEVIHNEINEKRLKDNVVVVRRLPNSFFNDYLLKNRKPGKGTIISDKAFLSTSLDLSYRKDIENCEYRPLNNETLMVIKVKKGTNAMYLEPASEREEFELLLPDNLDIMIEKSIRVLNNRIILAEIVTDFSEPEKRSYTNPSAA